MHGKNFLRPCALALLMLCRAPGYAQGDTSAIGGPEDDGPYMEAGAGPGIDEAPSADLMTAADSAEVIPGYNLYESWNTDVIFPRRDPVNDTVELRLSWLPCDHILPVCGRINSPFGIRHGRHHYGVDLDLRTGDPVQCAFSGLVRISRYHREFGNVVVVRHANGLETLYAHMSKRLVEEGDHVEAGQVIGLGGSTGRSTGSHLHFETRYLGHPIDPRLIFNVKNGALRSDSLEITPGLFNRVAGGGTLARADTYRVRHGDTLWSISRRTGVTVARLCRLNHLAKPDRLRIGQRLRCH